MLFHPSCPDPASSSVFGYFFEEVDVCIEEEAKSGGEFVNAETALFSCFYIGKTVGKRECQFLRCCRSCFSNVVAAD